MIRISFFIFAAALTLCGNLLKGQNSDFQKTMHDLLSHDFPKYQWRNIPVNGYGVATTYAGSRPGARNLRFLGGTYSFFGLKRIPANADSLMTPNEIIEAPCSPALNTTLQLKRDNVYKAFLPSIVSLFGFNAEVKDSLSRNATVNEMVICDRRIQEGAASNYIENLTQDPLQIKRNYNNDNLIMVVKDVVIKKMKISIQAGSRLAAQLDVELKGKLTKVVGDSAALGVKLSKLKSRTYQLEITTPVVAGFLAVKKGADSRGEAVIKKESAITGWSDKWMIATVPAQKDKPKIQ